jgi:hypothetical protein
LNTLLEVLYPAFAFCRHQMNRIIISHLLVAASSSSSSSISSASVGAARDISAHSAARVRRTRFLAGSNLTRIQGQAQATKQQRTNQDKERHGGSQLSKRAHSEPQPRTRADSPNTYANSSLLTCY